MFGTFETISIQWRVYWYNSTGSLEPVSSGQDISVVTGLLQFQTGVSEQSIIIDVESDGLPELTETYTVKLVSILGGSAGPRFGTDSSANLTIPENDDPYGLFRFTPTSLDVDIGEDIPTDDHDNGTGIFYITRNRGRFQSISVSNTLKFTALSTI